MPVDGDAKLKWEAWTQITGMNKDAAKESYISKVAELAPKYA